MTIKLLVAIQGAGGVEIPAGTEVKLSDAVEAAHVSANKAVYTKRPITFDAPPASGVGVKTSVNGGMKIFAGTASYTLINQLAQRIEAAQRGNAADRPPLTALDAWPATTVVRAGYAVNASGRVYMYTAPGTTGASAPTYTGLGAIADGSATCIYLGAPRTPVAAVDVPTISTVARPTTMAKRHNPITNPEKFLFSGGKPITDASGKGVLLPAYTTKDAGNIVTTTPGKANTNPAIEFCTNAPVFHVNDAAFTMSQSFRFIVEVDGYRLKDSAIMGAGNGSIKFDFSAYPQKVRTIRIYWMQAVATYPFEGVWTENAYNVWPSVQNELTAAIIGTSLTQGSGYSSFVSGQGWADEFASMCGLRIMHNLAQGSSGLNVQLGNRYSWLERIQDIFDVAPDILFVEGPHNDYGLSNQVANAVSFLSKIRAALPNTLIVCFGTNAELQSALPAMLETETSMRDAVAQLNDPAIWFVPVMTDTAGGWFFGYKHSGNITAMTNGANAQFTLSVTPTCVVGDTFVPFGMTGATGANGVIGHITAVAGNVVTTDIDTTSAGTFIGPSGYAQINDVNTSQDGVHPHQRYMRPLAVRYMESLRKEIVARIGR